MKYIDPSGYSYQRFMEIYAEEQRNNQPSEIFNNYPQVWSAYTSSIDRSYMGSYGNFVSQYYNALTNGQTSTNVNGTMGFYITWESSFTFTKGKSQEVRDSNDNLVGILLPEIGVGIEKHSVFVPSGGIEGIDYIFGSSGTPYGLESYYGPKYIGGTVPVPGIGVIGRYGDLIKITKGYKGAIQAHHLIETRFLKLFGISKNNAPAVILDKSTHLTYTKQLLNELPRGLEHSPTDVLNTYNKVYSSEPMWQQIIKALLGY
jgi:hypothetical protein